MARPPKGKLLTLRSIRLDDDVWAECQRLGKEYGTINEGLAIAQISLRKQESCIHDGFGNAIENPSAVIKRKFKKIS